jgi:hypothetical protein
MKRKRKPRKTELEKLIESDVRIKECYDLAFSYFKDKERTDLWFRVPNPFFDNKFGMPTPIELIKRNQTEYLLRCMRSNKR